MPGTILIIGATGSSEANWSNNYAAKELESGSGEVLRAGVLRCGNGSRQEADLVRAVRRGPCFLLGVNDSQFVFDKLAVCRTPVMT